MLSEEKESLGGKGIAIAFSEKKATRKLVRYCLIDICGSYLKTNPRLRAQDLIMSLKIA